MIRESQTVSGQRRQGVAQQQRNPLLLFLFLGLFLLRAAQRGTIRPPKMAGKIIKTADSSGVLNLLLPAAQQTPYFSYQPTGVLELLNRKQAQVSTQTQIGA